MKNVRNAGLNLPRRIGLAQSSMSNVFKGLHAFFDGENFVGTANGLMPMQIAGEASEHDLTAAPRQPTVSLTLR
ncbi:MAG: hypothetical protein AAGA12_12160 [Pseudomonadota bacterium]